MPLLETARGVSLRGVRERDEGVVHLCVARAAHRGEVGVSVFSPHGEDVVAHLGRGGAGAELAGRGAKDVHGEDAVLPREDGEVGGVREPRGGISRERRLAARVEAEPSALSRGAEDVRGGVSRDGERGVRVRRGGFPLHRGIAARVRGERDGDAHDRQEHHQHRARHVRDGDDLLLRGGRAGGDVPRSASRREATPAESTFVVVGMSGTFSARRLERTIAAGRRRARPRARGC